MRKKRVLFLMTDLREGGAEKVLIDILKNYDYSRYQVDLCLVYKRGYYIDQIPSEVNLIALHQNESSFPTRLFRAIHLRLKCDLLYKMYLRRSVSIEYDAIISFMEGYSLKFHRYIADRTSHNISWVHIDLLKFHYTQPFFKNIDDERQHYQLMSQLIFVSQGAKDAFCKLFGTVTNYQVIYNLIDREQIVAGVNNSRAIEKRRFTICSVGRLSMQKRFDRVIRVAALLKENHYQADFWILGIGELERELKELTRKLQVEDSVHFMGFVSPPYPYMAAADILLSTSTIEGAPLVICEAFCLGKPIVATQTTGPSELLDNSQYGILTDHDDSSICLAVQKLIDDPALLNHYHNQSLVRADMFDVARTMKQIYGLYD